MTSTPATHAQLDLVKTILKPPPARNAQLDISPPNHKEKRVLHCAKRVYQVNTNNDLANQNVPFVPNERSIPVPVIVRRVSIAQLGKKLVKLFVLVAMQENLIVPFVGIVRVGALNVQLVFFLESATVYSVVYVHVATRHATVQLSVSRRTVAMRAVAVGTGKR